MLPHSLSRGQRQRLAVASRCPLSRICWPGRVMMCASGAGCSGVADCGGTGAVCGVGVSWDLFFRLAAEGANGAKIGFLLILILFR